MTVNVRGDYLHLIKWLQTQDYFHLLFIVVNEREMGLQMIEIRRGGPFDFWSIPLRPS